MARYEANDDQMLVTYGEAFTYEEYAHRWTTIKKSRAIHQINENFRIKEVNETFYVQYNLNGEWTNHQCVIALDGTPQSWWTFEYQEALELVESYTALFEWTEGIVVPSIIIDTHPVIGTFATVEGHTVVIDDTKHIPQALVCNCADEECKHVEIVNNYYKNIAAIFSKEGVVASTDEQTEEEFEKEWNSWRAERFQFFVGSTIWYEDISQNRERFIARVLKVGESELLLDDPEVPGSTSWEPFSNIGLTDYAICAA